MMVPRVADSAGRKGARAVLKAPVRWTRDVAVPGLLGIVVADAGVAGDPGIVDQDRRVAVGLADARGEQLQPRLSVTSIRSAGQAVWPVGGEFRGGAVGRVDVDVGDDHLRARFGQPARDRRAGGGSPRPAPVTREQGDR